LQLQTSSALGVEVDPEAFSCTLCFEIKKMFVNFGDDVLISTLSTPAESRVKHENIMKLKHYM